jgi:hypothetical protein
MSIPPIAKTVLDYLNRFDLAAVARTRDNRLLVTRDPGGCGHAEAWWGRSSELGVVIKRANANSKDVVKAAAKVGVRLVEHSVAMQRVEELTKRLDARMGAAQREGDLALFNASYRRYRLDRFKSGKSSMSYPAARARLRAELAAVASCKSPPSGIIARIFDDGLPDPQ